MNAEDQKLYTRVKKHWDTFCMAGTPWHRLSAKMNESGQQIIRSDRPTISDPEMKRLLQGFATKYGCTIKIVF